MKKISLILMLMICLTGILSGCSDAKVEEASGEEENNEEKILVIANEYEPHKLNPIFMEDKDNWVATTLFRGLMKIDGENKIVKDIAEDYKIENDGRTYIFNLKKDVKFHDGSNLKAEDVAFTLSSLLDEKTNTKLKSQYDAFESIEALDEYTVKVELKYSYAPVLDKLRVGIIPKHAFEQGEDINTAKFNQNPIGSGPYKLGEWNHGENMKLEAFKDFNGGAPKVGTLVFKFIKDPNSRILQLQNGDIDFAMVNPGDVSLINGDDELVLHEYDSASYMAMMYNFKNDLFKDIKVREALNYSINREEVVEGILQGYGEPAYSPLQKNIYADNDVKKYLFNLDKANQILDEAGWVKNSDGIREKDGDLFKFSIVAPASDKLRVDLANYLSSQYKKIGVVAEVEALDWSAIKINEADAFMIGSGRACDADYPTYKMFHSNQPWNFGSYSNEKIDEYLEIGRKSTDEEERMRVYQEFQRELGEDPSYNMIAYVRGLASSRKDVSGIKEVVLGGHNLGCLWNIEEWDK